MTSKRRPSSSASKSVGRPTLCSGSSRQPSVVVRVRLPAGVYRLLRESVPNVSGCLRRLVIEFLERLPSYLEMEEFLEEHAVMAPMRTICRISL